MDKRECGSCRLCCKVFLIPELDKPQGFWCQHACSTGCAIYQDRPQRCRAFECSWLKGDLPLDARPDKLGVVFAAHRQNGKTLVVLNEGMPGRLTSDKVKNLVEQIRRQPATQLMAVTCEGKSFIP